MRTSRPLARLLLSLPSVLPPPKIDAEAIERILFYLARTLPIFLPFSCQIRIIPLEMVDLSHIASTERYREIFRIYEDTYRNTIVMDLSV